MKSSSKNKTFHLEIPSRTDNLEHARLFVSDIARDYGVSSEDIGKIELAVDEACTNIIKHAYKFNPEHAIHIHVSVANENKEKKKFVVHIKDTGAPFDYEHYHNPDMNEYFRKYRVGGLGIMLMKKLMDEVNYNMKPGQPNEVTLVKYIQSPA